MPWRRMTVRKRMQKKLQEIQQQLRMRMHAIPCLRQARGSGQLYRVLQLLRCAGKH